MARHTRKQRGGAFLGEGVKGKAYNVGRTRRNTDALYKFLKNTSYKAIHLETVGNKAPVVLTKKQDIDEFTDFLEGTRHLIGKVIKAPKFWERTSIEKEFQTELNLHRQILKMFGTKSDTFLTIQPVKGFRHHSVIGFVGIPTESKPPLYAIFGHKCDPHYKVDMEKFIVEITEALVELESHGYRHNDIKPDNIVRCHDRYKLIDWGHANTEDKPLLAGAPTQSGPMKFYVAGLPSYIARTYPYLAAANVHRDWFKTKAYKDLYYRIDKEFLEILQTTGDRNTLFKKYGPSSDLFQLGMTIALLQYEHNLKNPVYTAIADKLTSLKHPFSSAKEALAWIKHKV